MLLKGSQLDRKGSGARLHIHKAGIGSQIQNSFL